jgi:hypothetical protein
MNIKSVLLGVVLASCSTPAAQVSSSSRAVEQYQYCTFDNRCGPSEDGPRVTSDCPQGNGCIGTYEAPNPASSSALAAADNECPGNVPSKTKLPNEDCPPGYYKQTDTLCCQNDVAASASISDTALVAPEHPPVENGMCPGGNDEVRCPGTGKSCRDDETPVDVLGGRCASGCCPRK